MTMSALLQWLDENPERYRWFVYLVLSVVSFVALRPLLRKSSESDQVKSDWQWGWAILAVLFMGRWPSFFIPFELNLDESQLLAGVHSLRFDPVFWRSVDGTTSGPLDFYALIPGGSLIGTDGFLSARVTALALIASALLLVHQAATRIVGRTAARIANLRSQ